jgi:hypothetical protein
MDPTANPMVTSERNVARMSTSCRDGALAGAILSQIAGVGPREISNNEWVDAKVSLRIQLPVIFRACFLPLTSTTRGTAGAYYGCPLSSDGFSDPAWLT